MLMTFGMSNVEANYVQGLTHLTGLTGSARLTGNTFSADFARGRIGPLVLTQAHAAVADLATPGAPGDVTAHIDGSTTDILKLTDLPPLHYATRFGIDPSATQGRAGIDLNVHIPLRKNLGVDDVGIAVKVTATGFGIALSRTTRLNDGNIVFDIDNSHLHASGIAGLATSRLNVDWVEDFKAAGPVTSTINVKGLLDEAGREALGLHAGDYLRGPVGVDAQLTGRRGQLIGADMTLDLTPATLSLDLVGISKPAGFPAAARAVATFGPHSALRTENVTITGPGLQAAMTMAFNDEGSMVSLNAPSVKSGADQRLLAEPGARRLRRRHHGARAARSTAPSWRGAAPMPASRAAEPAAAAPAMPTPASTSHSTSNAKLTASRCAAVSPSRPSRSTSPASATAPRPCRSAARSARTVRSRGPLRPRAADRKLTLAAADIGTLAHGLFGFNSLKGGKLDFQATLHGPASPNAAAPPNDYEGVFRLKDFRLNQPFLARLFSAGSLIGFGNLLQNNGIAVDELKVPFSASNGVLAIHDARASGPAIGISAEGYIDRPKDRIALKGTLVPLFGINSMLGVIPLVGNVLVSKPGGGRHRHDL